VAKIAPAGAYESEVPVPSTYSAKVTGSEPAVAREEDWQEAVRLMSGLAEGNQTPEPETPAAPEAPTRTPAEWAALLGEPPITTISLARSLGPEGPRLPIQTWPLALPTLDAEASGVLLGKQYGTPPLALRVPKNRRVWRA
jgi:hypothetical protein